MSARGRGRPRKKNSERRQPMTQIEGDYEEAMNELEQDLEPVQKEERASAAADDDNKESTGEETAKQTQSRPTGKRHVKLDPEEKERRRLQREEARRNNPQPKLKKEVDPGLVIYTTSRRQQLLIEQQRERELLREREEKRKNGFEMNATTTTTNNNYNNNNNADGGFNTNADEEERAIPLTPEEVREMNVYGCTLSPSVNANVLNATNKGAQITKYDDNRKGLLYGTVVEEKVKPKYGDLNEDLKSFKNDWKKQKQIFRQQDGKAASTSSSFTPLKDKSSMDIDHHQQQQQQQQQWQQQGDVKQPRGNSGNSSMKKHLSPLEQKAEFFKATQEKANQDADMQLGLLMGIHQTLNSLSRAYKLSPMSLRQLHDGVIKNEPNSIIDEVHAALMRIIATDALESDSLAMLSGEKEHEAKVDKTSNASKIIVLDDGSVISRQTLDFDECFQYLDVVTWPAYVKKYLEKLRGRGNRLVPKCNWADHKTGGYYGTSIFEKIELLQFLLDETLNTNVIRNEIETREVLLEAGEFQVANGGLLTSKIGALIEVYGVDPGFRGSWYSGVVIAAAGDRIRVRYDELLSDEGNHKLEEWVTLENVRSHDWRLRRKKLTKNKLDPSSVIKIAQLARKKKAGRRKRAKLSARKKYRSNRSDDDRDAFPRVRPLNPFRVDRKQRLNTGRFKNDVVECFHNGGYWCGRISEAIGPLGRVQVQFPGENEMRNIKKEDIETMLTWDGEDWYYAGTDDVVKKDANGEKALTAALAAAADTHGDMCTACGRSGSLLCCDGCPSAFHALCVGESSASSKKYDDTWYCPECVFISEKIRGDKELRAQTFPFLRTECVLCETDGDSLGRKYFFSATDGIAKLEGGLEPKRFGSGRVNENVTSSSKHDKKTFEPIALGQKPFEEANTYLEEMRSALGRGDKTEPIEVFEKFGLGDCGKSLPAWETQVQVEPESESEEDVEDMELDEDDDSQDEHEEEKWSDLDKDNDPANKVEEEEKYESNKTGRARRSTAGKRGNMYSPSKQAALNSYQEALKLKREGRMLEVEEPVAVAAVVEEEVIDPAIALALEERRKLALAHAAKIEYESSLEKSEAAEKTSLDLCNSYVNKYAYAGNWSLAHVLGETARGRMTGTFTNQWFAPYPVPQPPMKPGEKALAKDKLGHVVAKVSHMERNLCGLLDGPWAGTETLSGAQWRQKWLASLRGSSKPTDVARWILHLESSVRPLAMKAAWYAQEVQENASLLEFATEPKQKNAIEPLNPHFEMFDKIGRASFRSEAAPRMIILGGKRVPIKPLRKCARTAGSKATLPDRIVDYRLGWRGRGMPPVARTLRAAWIAEVESASSAAYLALLLRFFDHHIAWDHIRAPQFHKITSNSYDAVYKNIDFRKLEIVEKRFAKWPGSGEIFAQYRLEPTAEEDSKQNSPAKKLEEDREEGNNAEGLNNEIKDEKEDEDEKKEERPPLPPMWINDIECPLFLMSLFELKTRGWTRADEKNMTFNPGFTPGRQSVTIPITVDDIGTHLAGCKIECLWEGDEVWYRGEITKCGEDREFGDEFALQAAREKAELEGEDTDGAFSNMVEITYETGELETMDIDDFKDIIAQGSIRARGQIPSRGRQKAPKSSKKEKAVVDLDENGEKIKKPVGRIGLLPQLPDLERAPAGTFMATAHLDLSRETLERMVFEKTGKDFSLWMNPKAARWKLALMLDEQALRKAIAEEKAKAGGEAKKRTGVYYIKKADRLIGEQIEKVLLVKDSVQAHESAADYLQPMIINNKEKEFKAASAEEEKKKEEEGVGVSIIKDLIEAAEEEALVKHSKKMMKHEIEERRQLKQVAATAMTYLESDDVPIYVGTFSEAIAKRCVLALDVCRAVKTNQTTKEKRGFLACTHIASELNDIEQKCNDLSYKNVAEFVKEVEFVFDQAGIHAKEFWEDIDVNARPAFRKAALLIVIPKPDYELNIKLLKDTPDQIAFENGSEFGALLENNRLVVCWDDGEWYTANVLKYSEAEDKYTVTYLDDNATETIILNKKPGRTKPDVKDVSFPWIFEHRDLLKPIDIEEARKLLKVCEYMDKLEVDGQRLIEYFYRLPDRNEFSEYYENVPLPIDLASIIASLIGGTYKYIEDFVNDCELMFDNALNFNAEGTEANDDAKKLVEFYRLRMQKIYSLYGPPPKPMPRNSEEENLEVDKVIEKIVEKKSDGSVVVIEKVKLDVEGKQTETIITTYDDHGKTTNKKRKSETEDGGTRMKMSREDDLTLEELKKRGLKIPQKTSWNATARCGKCRTCLNRALKKRCMLNPK